MHYFRSVRLRLRFIAINNWEIYISEYESLQFVPSGNRNLNQLSVLHSFCQLLHLLWNFLSNDHSPAQVFRSFFPIRLGNSDRNNHRRFLSRLCSKPKDDQSDMYCGCRMLLIVSCAFLFWILRSTIESFAINVALCFPLFTRLVDTNKPILCCFLCSFSSLFYFPLKMLSVRNLPLKISLPFWENSVPISTSCAYALSHLQLSLPQAHYRSSHRIIFCHDLFFELSIFPPYYSR